MLGHEYGDLSASVFDLVLLGRSYDLAFRSPDLLGVLLIPSQVQAIAYRSLSSCRALGLRNQTIANTECRRCVSELFLEHHTSPRHCRNYYDYSSAVAMVVDSMLLQPSAEAEDREVVEVPFPLGARLEVAEELVVPENWVWRILLLEDSTLQSTRGLKHLPPDVSAEAVVESSE